MATEFETALGRFFPFDHGIAAEDSEITAAEVELGVRIAGGYREMLRLYGWLGLRDLEVFGIGSGIPSRVDLVRITKAEREDGGLAQRLLPIMNDGMGNLYCLDTSEPEPAVVFWDQDLGSDQTPAVEAGSFFEWLTNVVAKQS